MNITLCPDIHWVGYVDWTVRDFHGYRAERGSTYNAYLVRDEKTALIDTVKQHFAEQLLQNVAACGAGVSPAQPGSRDGCTTTVDYVVCNHAEPDHSGALPRVMREWPQATVVCDAKCRAALGQHYDTSAWKFQVVADGDTLSLGRRTLRFIETPMVHWPESMFTYVPEERLLFSMDAFGQHYASSQRFDDEVPLATALDEAKTYYANIIMPYGKAVLPCLGKVTAGEKGTGPICRDQPAVGARPPGAAHKLDQSPFPLAVETIAPSHGVIWRRHVAEIIAAYRDWIACRPRAKVVVLYDTMWESTARMAKAIVEGASQPGVETQLHHLRRTDLTRIAAEVLDAAAVAFGCPTLNRGLMPTAAATLTYLQGLRPTGKAGLAFGSYGWAPGAVEALDAGMKTLGWEMLSAIKTCYRPTPAVFDQCRAAGRALAEKALAVKPAG